MSKNKAFIYNKKLFWYLLKAVSRSFYLSLRYLPKAIRLPLSLTYLIARFTDTLADSGNLSITLRRDLITQVLHCIDNPANQSSLEASLASLDFTTINWSEAEKLLISHASFLFKLFSDQSKINIDLIQQVMRQIIQGQLTDVDYFNSQKGTLAFSSDKELENYLYQVAGSVGVFWTHLGVTHVSNYSQENVGYLLPLAINFGKALQLTNILRDIPSDLALGRFYLPDKNIKTKAGTMNLLPETVTLSDLYPCINQWHHQALMYLKDAARYIEAIQNRRVRFACMLAYLIAKDTLIALQNESDLLKRSYVKISRQQVYRHIKQAFYYSVLPRWTCHD